MKNEHIGRCDICWETTRVAHFPMYVFGSEGINLCHDCEMRVHRFITEASRETMRKRRDEKLREKED